FLAVGWFWFLGMLVPVIGLVQVGVQAMADRYTYLPLVGLFLILAWAGAEFLGSSKLRASVGAIGAGLLVLACAVRTHQQVEVWRDTETVFTHNLAVTPDNWVAHHNL